MTEILNNDLSFHNCSTESLAELLGLVAPPFGEPKDPFRQIEYIYSHVKSLGCRTILLESHYIDRDYIEDYSLFYSKIIAMYRISVGGCISLLLNRLNCRKDLGIF
jgi:hypothetical protein